MKQSSIKGFGMRRRSRNTETSMSTSSTNSPSSMDMVLCEGCNRMVPEHNLELHQLRCTRSTQEHSSPGPPMQDRNETQSSPGQSINSDIEIIDSVEATAPPENEVIDLLSPPSAQRNDIIDIDTLETIDLVDDDVEIIENDDNKWACPRCTLLNPNTFSRCEACSYQHTRPPDASRRERLIPQQLFSTESTSESSSIPMALGGALLGGVVGGINASLRGRSVTDGLMTGAATGALGGAFMDDVMGFSSSNVARSSAARRRYPTSNAPSMTRVQIISGPSGMRSYTRYGHDDMPPELMALLTGASTHSIDSMNYEQLLERFGDGSENRGADQSVIRSLPSSVVTKEYLQSKDDDSKKCCICLEDFRVGDKIRRLPCLHVFHLACVDKWLKSNASCPICKHSITE